MFLLSKSFWLEHKRKAIAIICSYMLCAAAVVSACLYFRGLKLTEYWEKFENSGCCDMCFYDLSEEQLELLKADERFSNFGMMIRAGYAKGESGGTFVVGSLPDRQSEDMFYLPPEEGTYPNVEGEIAIDGKYLAAMGVRPEVGVEITLEFCDFEGNQLGKKTFIVCGILEMEYFTSAGFSVQKRQYPDYTQGDYDYSNPVAFLYWADYKKLFEGAKSPNKYYSVTYADLNYATLGQSDDYDVFYELSMENPVFKGVVMRGNLRSMNANATLGYQELGRDINVWGFNNVSKRLVNGTKQPDFYSDILMPCYMFALFTITMVSAICLFKVVLAHRKEHIRCYRMVGMTYRALCIMLITEMAVMVVIGLATGMVGGILLYVGVYTLLNHMGAGLHSAFEYNVFVNAVTFNPYISGILTVLVAFLGSIPMFLKELMPRKLQVSKQNTSEIKGLFSLLYKREMQWYGYQGIASSVVICVMTLAFLFGYLVYRADTDEKNNENYNILAITKFPYTAIKGYAGYGIFENLHSEGISVEKLNMLADNDMVEDYYAKMLNMSTKLSYSYIPDNKTVIEAMRSMETDMTAMPRFYIREENDDYMRLLAERRDTSLEYIGYSGTEVLFAAPTVGIPKEKIVELKKYITTGSIDLEALKRGEQVLFVMPQGNVSPVKAGDILPLTDVVLHEQAENSEALKHSSAAPEWAKVIRIDEWGGEEWPLYEFGGARKDIPVMVGAVVELPEEVLEKYFCGTLGAYKASFNLTTVGEAFQAWGLPDCNYTEIGVKPKDGFDRDAFETLWFQVVGASKNMSSVSQYPVYESMEQVAIEQMRIYLSLCFMMGLIGCIGCVNAVILRTEQLLPKLKRLGDLGADRKTIYQYALWTNMRVLPVTFCISAIATALLYGVAYIKRKYIYNEYMEERVGDFIFLRISGDSSGYCPLVVVLILIVFFACLIHISVSSVFITELRKKREKSGRQK